MSIGEGGGAKVNEQRNILRNLQLCMYQNSLLIEASEMCLNQRHSRHTLKY